MITESTEAHFLQQNTGYLPNSLRYCQNREVRVFGKYPAVSWKLIDVFAERTNVFLLIKVSLRGFHS